MAGLVEGKAVLVTGGSEGIGKATALAMAREGAKVAVASRGQAAGERVVAEIVAGGSEAIWIAADVSDPQSVAAMVDRTVEALGGLDCAFNNAGSGGEPNWVAEIDQTDWDATIAGYLTSTFACMKRELGVMLASGGGGVIINNASVDGLRGFGHDPAYAAAKHGVVGLTRSAAIQYAAKGVRINAVCPGWIGTPHVVANMERDPRLKAGAMAHLPIGRFGAPAEVAELVVWLCSDKASLIVGAALPVDGGYTAV